MCPERWRRKWACAMTPPGVGGWGTQCPLSLPHPARAPPVRLPQAQPQSTGSVRGRGWLWPWRPRPGLPEPWPLPPARPPGRRPGHRGNAARRGEPGDRPATGAASAPARPTRAPRSLWGQLRLPAPHSPPRSGASSTSSSTSSLLSAVAPAPALRGDGGSGLESGGGGASRTRTHAARKPRPPSSSPPLRVSVREVSSPPSPRCSGVHLKGPRRKGWGELRWMVDGRRVPALWRVGWGGVCRAGNDPG